MLISHYRQSPGMTLIELVIVVAILGILLVTAIPSYRSYVLRVNRGEAINMLLQASICQEQVHAARGVYDTGSCQVGSEQQSYTVLYQPQNTAGPSFTAIAVPQAAQRNDACGQLSVNQNGERKISANGMSVRQCWNGR